MISITNCKTFSVYSSLSISELFASQLTPSICPPPPTQIIHPFVTPPIRFSITERITSTSDEGKSPRASIQRVISFD